MQNKTSDKKFSIGEASKFLGVSIDTLRRWEKASKIKTLRSPGGHRYFIKSDLEGAFGQRYSRTAPDQEEVSKPTQIQEQDPTITSEPVISAPTLETVSPSNLVPKETPTDQLSQTADIPEPRPEDSANLVPPEPSVETPNMESHIIPEPISSSYPQTPEKRYRVEEITPPIQTQESLLTDKPEAYNQELSETATFPSSESFPVIGEQKFDEPLASFKTPLTSLPQSKIQPSQTEIPEVTVTPQEKKGSSTLKKVSLFLLIVFMMVNIILIGFYIFVSRQL